jgi:hypothetical protein
MVVSSYRHVVLGSRTAVKLQNFMGGAPLFLYNKGGYNIGVQKTWPSYRVQERRHAFHTRHTSLGTAYSHCPHNGGGLGMRSIRQTGRVMSRTPYLAGGHMARAAWVVCDPP